MSRLMKGLALALVQMLIMGSVAAKLVVDRARYPKVWVETAPFDPDLPIRGRYVRLAVVVEVDDSNAPDDQPFPEDLQFPDSAFRSYFGGRLEVRGNPGRLVAVPDDSGRHSFRAGGCVGGDEECVVLDEPLAFFIPERIPDPSIRQEDEELWVEVTLPPKGAPRPIRLGVKKDGSEKIEPLDI